MGISDTNIEDWSVTNAENPPTDSTYIQKDLAGQFRNIKSVARGETLEKEYQRTGYLTAGATAGSPAVISFYADEGDLTGTFTVDRKVRLRPSDGTSAYVYCVVLSSSHSGTTSVILDELSGSVTTGEEYLVDVGTPDPATDCLPLHVQAGTTTIANTDTNATVTFVHAMPDLDYFAKVQFLSNTSGLGTAARRVERISKTGTGLSMTITLKGAPGNGNTITLGWMALRTTL